MLRYVCRQYDVQPAADSMGTGRGRLAGDEGAHHLRRQLNAEHKECIMLVYDPGCSTTSQFITHRTSTPIIVVVTDERHDTIAEEVTTTLSRTATTKDLGNWETKPPENKDDVTTTVNTP